MPGRVLHACNYSTPEQAKVTEAAHAVVRAARAMRACKLPPKNADGIAGVPISRRPFRRTDRTCDLAGRNEHRLGCVITADLGGGACARAPQDN